MDEFELSDLEKEKNDYHNTCYQNTIHVKRCSHEKLKMWFIFSCLCYNACINLTGYHPPGLTAGPLIFFCQNLHPRDSFSVQNSGLRVKNETKVPIPGHNLPSSNAKISIEKGTLFYKSTFFSNFP